MPRRLRVLISAYACEPGKGSEPEVGWNWALQMSRFHDVTVLTRSNNRPGVTSGLAEIGSVLHKPQFVFHDLPPLFLKLKLHFGMVTPYYMLWQRAAQGIVARLHRENRYELLHHVTFAGYRFPVATGNQGVPAIWGPVGGIQSYPAELLPWRETSSVLREVLRSADNLVQGAPLHRLRKRALAHSQVIVSTHEVQTELKLLGVASLLMPTIGLDTASIPKPVEKMPHRPLKLLFVGQVITLKGADLAIDALHASGTDATLTFIGSGNYVERARVQARKLGLEGRVSWTGRVPRAQVLERYADYDAFLFPSVHDTGSFAVIEAMANQLPVICLDIGGPSVAVGPNCGLKIVPGPRERVVSELAQAIRHYSLNPGRLISDGAKAREEVLRRYEWDRKGEEMNEVYLNSCKILATSR